MLLAFWFPPEGELWWPIYCHKPGAEAKTGKWQQLLRLALGWNDPVKQPGQQQCERPDWSLSSWWLARLPKCCPFRGTSDSRSRQTDWLGRQSHIWLCASRRNKSPVAQLVPVAVLFLDLLPLNFPSCLREWARAVKRRARCDTGLSPPVPPHRMLIHVPKLPADQPSKMTKPNTVVGFQPLLFLHELVAGTQRSTCARQGTGRTTMSKDSGAGGTPAALTGICFNCWGTIASGSTVLRATGLSSDHPHLLSLFFSRLLPAARLDLTAFPKLQPSHCLKLLLFEEQLSKV